MVCAPTSYERPGRADKGAWIGKVRARSPFAALIQVFKDTEHSVIAKVLRLKFRFNFTSPAYSRRRLKFPWFEIRLVRRIPVCALLDYANPEGRITRILTVDVIVTLSHLPPTFLRVGLAGQSYFFDLPLLLLYTIVVISSRWKFFGLDDIVL